MKKILLVDDSALMRKVFGVIIDADDRFTIADEANNGEEALELLKTKTYDAMVLDIHMPKMDGLELLRELRRLNIQIRVLVASTLTTEGAQVTIEALELGALDFIHKPEWSYKCKQDDFSEQLLRTLDAVCKADINHSTPVHTDSDKHKQTLITIEQLAARSTKHTGGDKIVAIAVSTGGPKSLMNVVPLLPVNLDAPVVIVQHMPVGFTASLADRMNSMSQIKVVEAREGDVLKKGVVYLAKGGKHLNLVKAPGGTRVHYTDEPVREGVKPCANYMYESLATTSYDEVICVVMTGMGSDGTEGIGYLREKKKVYCISQESSSCVVYGMPKAVDKAGYSNIQVPLDKLAQEIILHTGVTKNGC